MACVQLEMWRCGYRTDYRCGRTDYRCASGTRLFFFFCKMFQCTFHPYCTNRSSTNINWPKYISTLWNGQYNYNRRMKKYTPNYGEKQSWLNIKNYLCRQIRWNPHKQTMFDSSQVLGCITLASFHSHSAQTLALDIFSNLNKQIKKQLVTNNIQIIHSKTISQYIPNFQSLQRWRGNT